MKQKREDVWTARYLVYQGTLTNKASSDEAMPLCAPRNRSQASHLFLNCSPNPGFSGVLQGCQPWATQWMDMALLAQSSWEYIPVSCASLI